MRYSFATMLALLSSFASARTYAQTPPDPASPTAAPPLSPPPPVFAPPPPPPPEPPKDGPSPVKTKWNGTLYGWVQADIVYDSSQSYAAEGTGGAVLAPNGTYAQDHDRTTFTFRNSRVGFRLNAPEVAGLRGSGLVEFDFNGNQPPGITETAFWSNATLRSRHVYMKLESDYVDILFGQTWHLFAWQPFFHPNSVQLQGLPGQVFTRSTQLRLSHAFKTDPLNVEIAVAAVRPPQRDAAAPDGQGGLKFTLNGWKGQHVGGAGAAPSVDGLSVGVSGLVRSFRVKQFVASANPPASNTETGWGVSIDGHIPVIPANLLSMGGALSLLGSFQTGSGFNDQYSGLTGGIGFPALPNPTMATPAPAYTPNIDPGLVTYDPQGNLHTIDWKVFLIGVQYFLPPAGNVWISGNYSQMESGNIADFGANRANVYKKMQFYDVNLFWNVIPSVRFAAEYAFFKQTMADDSTRSEFRGQFSGFYIF